MIRVSINPCLSVTPPQKGQETHKTTETQKFTREAFCEFYVSVAIFSFFCEFAEFTSAQVAQKLGFSPFYSRVTSGFSINAYTAMSVI